MKPILTLLVTSAVLSFALVVEQPATAQQDKPADAKLKGKRVAILVADGFEQIELTGPRKALDDAGAQTFIISPAGKEVRGWHKDNWGDKFKVDHPLSGVKAAEFDALLLPGGVINPDKLRLEDKAITFIQAMYNDGKPIAAICHGPWPLIDAKVIKNRKMTSWPSLKNDLRNAGATWVDEPVVADNGIITSRKPDDIPAFNRKMVEEFAEGKHDRSKDR